VSEAPPFVLDNPFWRFSCAAYAAPAIQEACLALQDRFGLDVNLALLCAWIGAARAGAMSEEDIAAAAALIEPWRGQVVLPLRDVRRRVKRMALMAEAAVTAFRDRVAALELEAEQLQQAILFRWADPRWPVCAASAAERAAANLAVLCRRHRGAEAPQAGAAAAVLAEAAERHAALSAR
jgi:uncharacterized protein (TIGR02444 family)